MNTAIMDLLSFRIIGIRGLIFIVFNFAHNLMILSHVSHLSNCKNNYFILKYLENLNTTIIIIIILDFNYYFDCNSVSPMLKSRAFQEYIFWFSVSHVGIGRYCQKVTKTTDK